LSKTVVSIGVFMAIATPKIAREQEIQRLQSLIPKCLRDSIELHISTEIRGQLVKTKRIGDRRCQIQIFPATWHSLDLDSRNLLFWHEVAMIRSSSIACHRSTYLSIGASLLLALADITIQDNVGLLATALLIAGLGTYHLYQGKIGEQKLRHLTNADRGAIELATDFGYAPQVAKEILASAILALRQRTVNPWLRSQYAARLQVLDLYNAAPPPIHHYNSLSLRSF
jgi:Protein of unknown function (DUF3318)